MDADLGPSTMKRWPSYRAPAASISFVQRQFRIGYNRAARPAESMEAASLASPMGINGQREVIAPGPQD